MTRLARYVIAFKFTEIATISTGIGSFEGATGTFTIVRSDDVAEASGSGSFDGEINLQSLKRLLLMLAGLAGPGPPSGSPRCVGSPIPRPPPPKPFCTLTKNAQTATAVLRHTWTASVLRVTSRIAGPCTSEPTLIAYQLPAANRSSVTGAREKAVRESWEFRTVGRGIQNPTPSTDPTASPYPRAGSRQRLRFALRYDIRWGVSTASDCRFVCKSPGSTRPLGHWLQSVAAFRETPRPEAVTAT